MIIKKTNEEFNLHVGRVKVVEEFVAVATIEGKTAYHLTTKLSRTVRPNRLHLQRIPPADRAKVADEIRSFCALATTLLHNAKLELTHVNLIVYEKGFRPQRAGVYTVTLITEQPISRVYVDRVNDAVKGIANIFKAWAL